MLGTRHKVSGPQNADVGNMEINMNDIQAGVVVELKSGGPLMTVMGVIDINNYVKCCWFKCDQSLEMAIFHIKALKTAADTHSELPDELPL